ncbi:hypothetical protein HII31_07395 [Pseudocercospora fuligena]|uniref:Uncharacterized protein n=1 Tax=Pseudocercospora fuligena TaxID=685502 RepID=A0A8H6RID1_9PEZI|nr:hypothetical protein HII31_07395 [Pseudocercospora fuligena]
MGCFPSKEQDAEDVVPSEEEKTAVSAATQVEPEQAAADRTKRSRKRAYLALIERRNAHREISIPQWPNPAERSLDLCLPVAIDYVEPRGVNIGHTGPVGWDVFKNTKDRWKFIKSALLVLSSNGLHTISSNRVDLFFPRIHFHDAIAYRASLAVMMEDGSKIKHSIVSANWGANRRAAFIHLMFDIEKQLEAFLSSSLNHVPVLKNDGLLRPPRPAIQPRQNSGQNSVSSVTSSTRHVTPRCSQPHISAQPTYQGRVLSEIGYSQYYHIPSRPQSTFVYQNPAARPAFSTINTHSLGSLRPQSHGYPGFVSYSSPQARKVPAYSHDYQYDWRLNDPEWSIPENYGVEIKPQKPRRPTKSKSSSDLPIRYRSLDPRLSEKASSKSLNPRYHGEPKVIENEYYAKELLNERTGDLFFGDRESVLKKSPRVRVKEV